MSTSTCLAKIFDEIDQFLARFVAYPSEAARSAHVLWTAHTHCMTAWDSTPRLAFLSPEPGSGKTRALELTETLVPRPVEAVNFSPAYLFRKVGDAAGAPTLLVDEVDTIFGPKAKGNEEIRGLLNAGHRRGAVTGRCVLHGKRIVTEEISAYCAVALAGLGELPDTILGRSVVIPMRRRAPHEQVEPYRRRDHAPIGFELRDRLSKATKGILGTLAEARPNMPCGVVDRDADVWEPLIVLADAAGGAWPQRARAAALELITHSKERNPSFGLRLLSDLRRIFDEAATDRMPTYELLERLNAIEDAPWGDLGNRPLDSRRLARMLRPYEVRPVTMRSEAAIFKGYRRSDLHDIWLRYLPPKLQNA